MAIVSDKPSSLETPGSGVCVASQQQAPLGFLDLPLEIQKNVVDLLVASLTRPGFGIWKCEVVSWSDLKNLGLTCQKLYRLVAPIYQRRLVLSSWKPYRLHREDHGVHNIADQCRRVSRSLRVVNVTSLYFDTGYWSEPTEQGIRALEIASRELFERIPGLQSLSIAGDSADTVVGALLGAHIVSLRSLHIEDSLGQVSQLDTFPCLSQLRALKLGAPYSMWLRALPKMTHLEDLTIYDHFCGTRLDHKQLEMPDWPEPECYLRTLRRLRLRCNATHEHLVGLFGKIKAYRQKELPFVLEELHLEAPLSRAMIDELWECLAGHSGLEALSLSVIDLEEMSPSVIEDILDAGLVNLRRLFLLTHWYLGCRWPSGLEAYIEPLSKLTRLHAFSYNYHEDEDDIGPAAFMDTSTVMPEAEMLFTLVPSLQIVYKISPLFRSKDNTPDGFVTFRGSKGFVGEFRPPCF